MNNTCTYGTKGFMIQIENVFVTTLTDNRLYTTAALHTIAGRITRIRHAVSTPNIYQYSFVHL